ncbi:alpha/beta hydrolase-fold protein [Fulvivirga ligni]|uniref:alpha/beta hydrolase-fold protein n=1 Tax=Fulvivirga ligni TaxID=2904246 RepID=UPI001F22F235|nr:alpha/beta hydrolase-fold protein [Fulvivirga ligni]UII20325.1 esterase family protein [Fulvivirga ligni]
MTRLILLNLLSIFFAIPVFSQQAYKHEHPLIYAHQEVIHSKILNEERAINIYLPQSFYEVSEEHTYPVLLLLEDEFFFMVSGVVQHLSAMERMPETVVISLVEDPVVPKLYTNGSDFWPASWKQLPFGEDPDPFTLFIKDELLPHVRSSYRINNFSMIMGLSGTSIYAFHTLIKEPGLFSAHITMASGDILGMGYREGESLIDLVVNEPSTRSKGYLYVASDSSDGRGTAPMILKNIKELERRLAPFRNENFKFISKVFENEGHYDIALPGLQEALNMIFPPELWAADYRDIIKAPGPAMDNLDAYYSQLSNIYGFKILPRAERWNSVRRLSWIGPHLVKEGQLDEGIEVIKRWAEYRPFSSAALIALGQAYEKNADITLAISNLKQAMALAQRNGNDTDFIVKEIQRLEALK